MIFHSIKESKLFNLKFGRYEGVLNETEKLREQIINEQFDFVRLKILNPGENLFVLLHKIGFAFHLLDIHRLYNLDLHTYQVPPLELSEMEFVICDGANQAQMKQLVIDTYTELPMGFFQNEMLGWF